MGPLIILRSNFINHFLSCCVFHQSLSVLLCVSSIIVCLVVCFINHCLSCCVFHQSLSVLLCVSSMIVRFHETLSDFTTDVVLRCPICKIGCRKIHRVAKMHPMPPISYLSLPPYKSSCNLFPLYLCHPMNLPKTYFLCIFANLWIFLQLFVGLQ